MTANEYPKRIKVCPKCGSADLSFTWYVTGVKNVRKQLVHNHCKCGWAQEIPRIEEDANGNI